MGITAENLNYGAKRKLLFSIEAHDSQLLPFNGDLSSVFVSHALTDFASYVSHRLVEVTDYVTQAEKSIIFKCHSE